MVEKRKYTRYTTSWKVYDNRDNSSRLIGYIMDLSLEGAKIIIQKSKEDVKETIQAIKITPTKNLNLDPLVIGIEKRWMKESLFVELGLEFKKLNEKTKENLTLIIEEFKKENKPFGEAELL